MKISVIVPVYKVEPYLRRCVDSILAQSFTDFDLVLVDDGSPDNCGAICNEYAEKDKRITVIHKENGGLSDARNFGIDWAFTNSDSEWLTFIDSDDWVHTDYLRILYKSAIEANTNISVCSAKKVCSDYLHDSLKADSDHKVLSPEELYCGGGNAAAVAWGKLYRKSLFSDIRYPKGRIHEDEFTTYKLLFLCNSIAFSQEELYYYYLNPEGITKVQWNLNRLDAVDAFYEQVSFFKKNDQQNALATAVERLVARCTESVLYLRQYYPEEKALIKRYTSLLKKTINTYSDIIDKTLKTACYPAVHYRKFQTRKMINRKIRHFKELLRGE